MADSVDKLSPDQIKALSKTLSDANILIDRQAELIDKLIKGETDIGKTRIAYLEQYFDIYSKNLDIITRRQSQLSDGILVLEGEISKASSKASKASSDIKSTSVVGDAELAEIVDDIIDGVAEKFSERTKSKKGGYQLAELEPERNLSDGAVATSNTIDEENREKLEDENKELEKRANIINYLDKLSSEYYKTVEERENDLEKIRSENDEYANERDKHRIRTYNKFAREQEELEEMHQRLYNLRHQDKVDKENLITDIRIKNTKGVLDAEIEAQEKINRLAAEREFYTNPKNIQEMTEMSNRQTAAKFDLAEATKHEEALQKKRAQLELYYKRKNGGILDAEDAKKIQKRLKEQLEKEEKNADKLAERQKKHRANLLKIESEKANAEEREELQKGIGALTAKGASLAERKEALYGLTHDADGNVDAGKAISAAMLAVSDLAKQLEGKIDEIAGKKGAVDTRLQGSNNKKSMGSYWDQLVKDMTSVGAINPFFKQETFAANIETLVAKGISFDLKQRAFLMTISDKIASTFEVSNATLLRLVRIQQEDSTAGRLGMESALNAFLNNMYETSEYLSDVASSVKGSLEEMEALMKGAEATEVEWQVQKWLGSLYSVGMSSNAVQGISGALGQIAAGQIEGLNGGAGNLIIMAANDAGLSIADILTDGINAKDTNKLMQAAVNYLAELADSAKDNKVVQQQLAEVFGVKASDLRAATNLVLPGSTSNISGYNLTYGNMLSQLSNMAGSMWQRTSIAEMMTNFWQNGQYTLAGSMASNPVSYFIYKMAKVVDDAAGGIDLPFLNVMGFGVDLNTTVSDLMRVAAVGAGILGSIGPMISGLGSSFSGQAMLKKLGISTGSGLAVTPRGDGVKLTGGGGSSSMSESGYAGNASGSDIKNSTIQEAEDSKKKQMIEAKEEEESNQVDVLNQTVIKIYELLDDVAHGNGSFKVKMEGYGLVSNKSSSSSSLSGVSRLEDVSMSSGGIGSNNTVGGLSSNLEGRGNTGFSFSGWTVTV